MTEYCRLCCAPTHYKMSGLLMNTHLVKYYDCPNCGYIQTEKPFWLAEAYKSPINSSDTGILERNYQNVWLVFLSSLLLFKSKFRTAIHIDYAGGYGILVSLLRNLKIKSYWHDKYCANLFATNFIWDTSSKPRTAEFISALEVFEHFESPAKEIDELILISKNVLFTTRLIQEPIPKVGDWWYYGEEHGQHIGFYRRRTLDFLAKKYGLNLLTDGKSAHILTSQKIPSVFYKAICILSKLSLLNILKRL